MEFFGIKFVGLTSENGRKFLLMLGFIAAVLIIRFVLNGLVRLIIRERHFNRARFWLHQGINLTSTVLILLDVLSIWFDDRLD